MTIQQWMQTRVSLDEKCHLIGNRPLYKKRFLQVLSFHAPGLAAVQDKQGAYHIDTRGIAAYSRVFIEAVGFYENLSAVRTKEGWFHIKPDGTPAYDAFYTWCGNFQGGHSVVRTSTGYCHILPNGSALYKKCFLYAGDFRERRAVVRLHNGLCAHIDESGCFAHDKYYEDLDVYHKSFARARDKRGWMHIDSNGKPIYKRRFLTLEPFYNGRALAKTFDGEIITIDISGKNTDTIMSAVQSPISPQITPAKKDNPFDELSADMVGYWKTYALAVIVKLNVAGKFPISDNTLGLTLRLPPEGTRVLIDAMAELGIVKKIGEIWHLTAKGKLLDAEHPKSLAGAAQGWAALAKLGIESWQNAIQCKKNKDIFTHLSKNKQQNELMHAMLATYAKSDYAKIATTLPPNLRQLIDAGGGDGTTANLIVSSHKKIHVTVLERPEVFPFFQKKVGINSQISFQSGDLFFPWGITADAVLMARILHDWDDAHAMTILRNARTALCGKGILFLAERIKHAPTEDGLCSFHLSTIGGGRERTLAEYKDMMTTCGFNFVSKRILNGNTYLLTGEIK